MASNPIYWASWSIAIVVGLITNFIAMFDLDKKYYEINITMAKLKIEGWEYLELSGKYGESEDESTLPTHTNKFKLFCTELEKIKNHVRAEFKTTSDNKKKSKPSSESKTSDGDEDYYDSSNLLFRSSGEVDNKLNSRDFYILKRVFELNELELLILFGTRCNGLKLEDKMKLNDKYNHLIKTNENDLQYLQSRNKDLHEKIVKYIFEVKQECKKYDNNRHNEYLSSRNLSRSSKKRIRLEEDRITFIKKAVKNKIQNLKSEFFDKII